MACGSHEVVPVTLSDLQGSLKLLPDRGLLIIEYEGEDCLKLPDETVALIDGRETPIHLSGGWEEDHGGDYCVSPVFEMSPGELRNEEVEVRITDGSAEWSVTVVDPFTPRSYWISSHPSTQIPDGQYTRVEQDDLIRVELSHPRDALEASLHLSAYDQISQDLDFKVDNQFLEFTLPNVEEVSDYLYLEIQGESRGMITRCDGPVACTQEDHFFSSESIRILVIST